MGPKLVRIVECPDTSQWRGYGEEAAPPLIMCRVITSVITVARLPRLQSRLARRESKRASRIEVV